jgi:hypothetical protein
MKAGPSTLPVRRGKNNLEILMYIVLSSAVIFYIDTVTPIGLAIWILYFVPLFLTIYIGWKYAPFLAAGVFIVLTFISLFLSPEDTPLMYGLVNRGFFALVLVVAAFFIYWIVQVASQALHH